MHGYPVPFVLFRDRDEIKEDEINRIRQRLKENRSHFLKRREIENYALDYKAILALLSERSTFKSVEIKTRIEALTEEALKTQVMSLAEQLKMKVILLRVASRLPQYQIFTHKERHDFVERNMSKDPSDIINDIAAEANDRIGGFNRDRLKEIFRDQETYVGSVWTDSGILNICPGKDLRRLISNWTRSEFDIELSVPALIEKLDQVDEDIIDLLTKITSARKDVSKTQS